MDADVAIQDFVSDAYVIERPASADLLADKVTSLLAKKGLRIEFGNAKKSQIEHDVLLGESLPDDIGFISRCNGQDGSNNVYSTLIAGPRLIPSEQGSPDRVASSSYKSWKMLGHAINGTDEVEATAFAAMMVVKKRVSTDVVNYFVENTEEEYGKGHPASSMIATISLSTGQMRSDKMFMSKDTYETLATAKAFVARTKNTNSQEKQSVVKGQDHVASGFLILERDNNPQLGQVKNNELSGRFKVKKFTGPYIGPSYLPSEFGTRSRATAQWLHPDLLKVVARAREIAGIKFEIVPGTGGIRSSALQQKLKKAGKSKATVERHTIGHAIDLVPLNKKGNYDFGDHEGFEKIRAAMQAAAEELNIPIQWGGNWKSLVDKPHYELDRVFYPAEGEGPDRRIKVEPYQISAAFR